MYESVEQPCARCYTRDVTWKAKDRGLWLTLAALTVLLVVLAALQYRWTSEIGRAEAERRQAQLERSAWRFGNAFDREIARLLTAFFRMEPLPPGGDPRALLLERLAAWRPTSTPRSSPPCSSRRARPRARSPSRPAERTTWPSTTSRGRRISSRCAGGFGPRKAGGTGSSSGRGRCSITRWPSPFPSWAPGPPSRPPEPWGRFQRHGAGAAAAGPGLPPRAVPPPAGGGALRPRRRERVRRLGGAHGRSLGRLLDRPRNGRLPCPPAGRRPAQPPGARGPAGSRSPRAGIRRRLSPGTTRRRARA